MPYFLKNLGKLSEEKPVMEAKYFAKYKDVANREAVWRLLEEYRSGDIVFEPVREGLTEPEQEDLYMQIDKSNLLSSQEKIETIISLMMLLDGVFPEPQMVLRLEKVFGKEFMEAVEKKREEFKTEIAVKKLTSFVKRKFERNKNLVRYGK